jgi:hypothetical protein
MTTQLTEKPQTAISEISKERAEFLTSEIKKSGELLGSYLGEMCDTRGYKKLGYPDFIAYCRSEFNLGKSRGYQLIQEAQIAEDLKENSTILEKAKFSSSHYQVLAEVEPSKRVRVAEIAIQTAQQRNRKVTALDLTTAAMSAGGGFGNQGKFSKRLTALGYKAGAKVVVNKDAEAQAYGEIEKVRDDGLLDVYLYGFNFSAPYSISDVTILNRTHIPLLPEEATQGQSVQIFSPRLGIENVEGMITKVGKNQATVEVDGEANQINYEELAAIPEAANQIVDVETYSEPVKESTVVNRYPIPPFNNEAIDENWVKRHLETLVNWLADNADDRQRLEIFLALIEKLTPDGRKDAEQLFTNNDGGDTEKLKKLEEEFEKYKKTIGEQQAHDRHTLTEFRNNRENYLEEKIEALKSDINALRKELDIAKSKNNLKEDKEKQQNNSESIVLDQLLKVKEKARARSTLVENELQKNCEKLEATKNSTEAKKLKTAIRQGEERLAALEFFDSVEIGQRIGIKDETSEAMVLDISMLGAMPDVLISKISPSGKETKQQISAMLLCRPPEKEPEPAENYNQELELFKQVEEFERVLIPYLTKNGLAKNPPAYANTVCKGILKGDRSPLFENFLAGRPLGGEVKQDWEIAPGQNYPTFEEDRINYYVHRGEPIEQATVKARGELRNHVTAQDLWDGFLRKANRIADEAIKTKELGVENPALPAAFTEQEIATKESVFEKLESLNLESSIPQQKSLPEEIPTIESLRQNSHLPAAKAMAIKAIETNPHWGYIVADLDV